MAEKNAIVRRRPAVEALGAGEVRSLLGAPDQAAHKYTRGVVGVRTGSSAYPGAAVLSVSAETGGPEGACGGANGGSE